jgi:hypothetical protein
MTDVNGMNCAEFADASAELALGVLTGRERGDALAHLDYCDACAAHVRQLTTVGEQLIGLPPSREPPPGFETRVLAQLRLTAPGPRPVRRYEQSEWVRGGTTRTFGKKLDNGSQMSQRGRRMLAAAAAAVAVAGAGLGGWSLHAATSHSPLPTLSPPTLSEAALLSAGRQNAGEVFLHNGEPQWVYMSVHLESGTRTGTVICQLESPDGRVTTVGSFLLADGYGSWGSPAWVGNGIPVGARLVTANGTVLATASFQQAAAS